MFYSKLLHIIVFVHFTSNCECQRLRIPFEKKTHEWPGQSSQTGKILEEPSNIGNKAPGGPNQKYSSGAGTGGARGATGPPNIWQIS